MDSPSAPVGGGSPPREEVNIQILEMMKDFREHLKTPSSKEPRGMTADEISAITQRGGSPLAGLEFKQTLPVIKDSTWTSNAIFESFERLWTATP